MSDDNLHVSRAELKEIIKEVFDEKIKSDEFRETLTQIWRKLIVNYIGESIVSKLSFVLWLSMMAFLYWIYDSGFWHWLKNKGLM